MKLNQTTYNISTKLDQPTSDPHSFNPPPNLPFQPNSTKLEDVQCRTLPRMAISATITRAVLPFHSRFTSSKRCNNTNNDYLNDLFYLAGS